MSSAHFDPSISSTPMKRTESEASPISVKPKLKARDSLEKMEGDSPKVYSADIENPRLPTTDADPKMAEEVVDAEIKEFKLAEYLKRIGSAQLAAKVMNNLIKQHAANNEFKRDMAVFIIRDIDNMIRYIKEEDLEEWLAQKIDLPREKWGDVYRECLNALESEELSSEDLESAPDSIRKGMGMNKGFLEFLKNRAAEGEFFDFTSAYGNEEIIRWIIDIDALPTEGGSKNLYLTIELFNAATLTPQEINDNPLYKEGDLLDFNYHAFSLLLSNKGASGSINRPLSA